MLKSATQTGSRKVILTFAMLIIYAMGTAGYLFLLGIQGQAPSESFFFYFTLGVGGIGGAFTMGNMVEHKYKNVISTITEQKEVTK